jgi:hypothetical protein
MGLDEDLLKAAEKGDVAAARAALDGGADCECYGPVRRRVERAMPAERAASAPRVCGPAGGRAARHSRASCAAVRENAAVGGS